LRSRHNPRTLSVTKWGNPMARAHRRPVDAPETHRRRELERIALAQLLDVGPKRLTMQSVADEANCAKGLLFWYFESKTGLLAAVVETRFQLLSAVVTRALRSSDPSAADAMSSFLDENSKFFNALESWSQFPGMVDIARVSRQKFHLSVTEAVYAARGTPNLDLSAFVIATVTGLLALRNDLELSDWMQVSQRLPRLLHALVHDDGTAIVGLLQDR
jgi:AcrR family transcriptional regulator